MGLKALLKSWSEVIHNLGLRNDVVWTDVLNPEIKLNAELSSRQIVQINRLKIVGLEECIKEFGD